MAVQLNRYEQLLTDTICFLHILISHNQSFREL